VNNVCDEALRDVLLLLQVEVIVAIGKFAEKRANLAVAGTELQTKIKVITLHYLACSIICIKKSLLIH
jgi:hypothetical protein